MRDIMKMFWDDQDIYKYLEEKQQSGMVWNIRPRVQTSPLDMFEPRTQYIFHTFVDVYGALLLPELRRMSRENREEWKTKPLKKRPGMLWVCIYGPAPINRR